PVATTVSGVPSPSTSATAPRTTPASAGNGVMVPVPVPMGTRVPDWFRAYCRTAPSAGPDTTTTWAGVYPTRLPGPRLIVRVYARLTVWAAPFVAVTVKANDPTTVGVPVRVP